MTTHSFGDRVRAERERRGLSQAALAKLSGVTRSAVSQWESGRTQSVRPLHLLAVSDALGVSIRQLVTGKDPYHLPAGKLDGRVSAMPRALRDYVAEIVMLCERATKIWPDFLLDRPADTPEIKRALHRQIGTMMQGPSLTLPDSKSA